MLSSRVSEPVERRSEVRGHFRGVRLILTGARAGTYEVLEASRRSFFVELDDPERFRLAERCEAGVVWRDRTICCLVMVTRVERTWRTGVALRIIRASPEDEAALREIFGASTDWR